MSNDLNRRLPLGQEAAVVSLVAVVACAFAGDAAGAGVAGAGAAALAGEAGSIAVASRKSCSRPR